MEKILKTQKLSKDSKVEKYVRPNGTIGIRTINNDVSMADPTGFEQSKIENILINYQRTGTLPLRGGAPIYSPDEVLPNSRDLMQANLIITEARDRFDSLPSTLRERFGNDPISLHDFLSDPQNLQEAIKIGLYPKSAPSNDEPNDEPGAKNQRSTKPKPPKQNILDPKNPDQE